MADNKYFFRGILKFDSALHIGGGTINEMNTDSPIVKTPDGLPYIPGSSLKGAFRSFVERLAAGITSVETCQLNEKYKKCPSSKASEWSIKDKTEDEIVNYLDKNLCDTCKLFGSPHRASKVFFKDLSVLQWAEMTQVRDGVVINRDSGIGVPNLKYDFEIIPTDSLFSFEIFAENLDETDLALLAIGINELLFGTFQLGGNTTRGLGNCQLDKLEIFSSDWQDFEQFRKYLSGQTVETKYTREADAKQFLLDKINDLFDKKEKK